MNGGKKEVYKLMTKNRIKFLALTLLVTIINLLQASLVTLDPAVTQTLICKDLRIVDVVSLRETCKELATLLDFNNPTFLATFL